MTTRNEVTQAARPLDRNVRRHLQTVRELRAACSALEPRETVLSVQSSVLIAALDYVLPELEAEERFYEPPCMECGAKTPEEAETVCRCGGDKDDCHGCQLWPD